MKKVDGNGQGGAPSKFPHPCHRENFKEISRAVHCALKKSRSKITRSRLRRTVIWGREGSTRQIKKKKAG